MAQLEMASFTVVTKSGSRYAANNLQIHLEQPGWRSMLSFICSGAMSTIPADIVERIEWRETGRTYCDQCDEHLTSHAVLETAAVPGPQAPPTIAGMRMQG